ncbi:MAG: serine/threonine protein kinase [Planctomycetes bacterium]|nr:serine/threonine protein kinase [Planctomycetota bacterium]
MTDTPSEDRDLVAGARRQVEPQSVERAEAAPPGEAAGDRIDRYKLLQEIGAGGMGTVWMAEQLEPVRRRVALKIIKLGMDTREVVVRFEAERQALALMDHPHIAKVLDGGATATGRPYFVMELVKGVPITEFCDGARLGLRERLELFSKVCEAIQHAHHKGVIHRDIKPTNVLVTLHDGVPVPKVIDFGIAKATSAELTQKTLFTQYAQIIGTPEYMAPEQAELSGLDIDTRADVYSLGVLLYELLTGTKPFEIRTVLEVGYQELLRMIREVDPAKPSTRVSTLGRTASSIEGGRQVNVDALSRRLRGDLDWIVMKALEKDRTRRYETANAFAADVARYLSGEAVEAAPPSAVYRARKFVARRRKTVAALGVIAFLLVAGSIGTGTGWWYTQRANEALDVALADKSSALEREAEQRRLAEANESQALSELKRADELTALMSDLLRSVTPEVAKGADVAPFRKMLERAAQRLADGSIEDPLVRLRLRHMIGKVYFLLGLYPEAEQHLLVVLDEARALQGEQHPLTATAHMDLGALRLMQDRGAEAERELRAGYVGLRDALGEGDPAVRVASLKLATYYGTLQRIQEALAVLGADADGARADYDFTVFEDRAHARTVALLWCELGRADEARELYDELVTACAREGACEESERNALDTLRVVLDHADGDFASSVVAARAVLARKRAYAGDDHPETLVALTDLASQEADVGRLDEAEALVAEALERSTRVLGPRHRVTLQARYVEAWLAMERGDAQAAETLYERLLADVESVFGGGDHLAETVRHQLALVHSELGRVEEAAPELRAVLEAKLERYPPDHPEVLGARTNLAGAYLDLGRFAEAAEQAEISLPLMRATLGTGHPWTGHALYVLAHAYSGLGRHAEALPLHREWIELRARYLEAGGDDLPPQLFGQFAFQLLTYPVEELQDPARAVVFVSRACERAEAAGDPDLWDALDTLAFAQFRAGDAQAAVASQERALAHLPAQLAARYRADFEARLAEYRAAVR